MADEAESVELEQRGFRSPVYREITPDYIFGGGRPGYIEMILVTTKFNAVEAVINKKNVLEHTEEVALKIPPQQAKSMVIWLLQNIKSYENAFGKIKSAEKEDAEELKISEKVEELLNAL